MSAFSRQLEAHVLDLLWSLWAELGVSGWERRHGDWYIDPEPLIAVTAWLGDADPRLRDETTDWCVRYGRYVSVARLKHVLRTMPEPVRQAFGTYAATVGVHAGFRWPGAAGATAPRPLRLTGRSGVDQFARPAQLALRARALFGVGARAEILRTLVASPPAREGAGVASFADSLYTSRNIAVELESLHLAGVLRSLSTGRTHRYALRAREHLAALLAPLPIIFPPWMALWLLVHDLLDLSRLPTSDRADDTVAHAVEVSRVLRLRQHELLQLEVSLGAPLPPATAAPGYEAAWTAAVEQWALSLVAGWARGVPAAPRYLVDQSSKASSCGS